MKRAFTLVELSIVLVIIGLLTAGVVGGQSLIESSKINSQITQIRNYDQASLAFQLEYDAIPGDMKNAFDYWGTSCGPDAYECNGDGNGKVGTISQISAWDEPYMFFPHLNKAGLLDQNINHRSSRFNVGTEFPLSKLGQSGISVITLTNGLYFYLGPVVKNATVDLNQWVDNSPTPALTSKQAYNMDKKLDDGLPNLGKIYAINITNSVATNFGKDTTSSCILSSGASYNLTSSTLLNCRILIKASLY